MKLFNEEGRLKDFKRRVGGKRSEVQDWKTFMGKGKKHEEKIGTVKPDVVEQINQKIREYKEKERKRNEERKNGEWDYNGESGEWYWTGKNEPVIDTFCYPEPTEEEKKVIEEGRKQEFAEYVEEMKRRKKEKRQMKLKQVREAMAIPLDSLPEQ